MAKTFLTALILFMGLFPIMDVHAQNDMKLLLDAVYLSDDRVTDHVSLWGNDIDPNSSSVDDRYVLQINGETVQVPASLLASLDHQRRDFSYDSQSGGIRAFNNKVQCMMAGPATGVMLHSRYLTYENHQIVADEMRPVFSKAQNCIFNTHYQPERIQAHGSAVEVLASLHTIKALFRK